METIDYPKRSDLVAALVDARKRGIEVEVVGNGRTLKFPAGIEGVGATEEDLAALAQEEKDLEAATVLGVVEPLAEVEQEPDGDQADRTDFTVEGTCSVCEQAAIADETGSWVHVEASSHGDSEGEFVPNEASTETPAAEPAVEDEDLIGTPAPQVSKSKRKPKGT